jgi:transcriptional regulator with PAS, ATPase and Fis domain
MPLTSQAKLLRVIQEREVQRLGSLIAMEVDVRVIATSNRHLTHEVGLGRFREDLYYRLNVVPIHVPPLRVRKLDIPVLVAQFLCENNRDQHRSIRGVSPAAMILLESYTWPGNVRELENVITRAVVIAVGPILEPDDFLMALIDKPAQSAAHPAPNRQTIQEAVHDLILAAYEDEGHNQTRTADRLGITTRTLRNKLYDYHVLVHNVHPLSSLAERMIDRARSEAYPQ